MSGPAEDTIAAISTPPGRGGVALVRISGPGALDVAGSLGIEGLRPREARLAVARSPDGVPIDRVLATWFRAPASFTGEDVVELSGHGGVLVPALLLDAACSGGARVAEPGEFTRRAYLNGKIDLIQAEATLDLIDATSPAQGRSAMALLGGRLSERVDALRRRVVELEALLGYDIDFPDEDEGPVAPERIVEATRCLEVELEGLLENAPEGERLRQGALTVIAGAPNVGKSSVFNELAGFKRAIVTEIPGTTRDAVEVDVAVEGYPFRLVDTAGVRDAEGRVEEIGIEVARGYVGRAELILHCVETGRALAGPDRELAREADRLGTPLIRVWTKADLAAEAGSPSPEAPGPPRGEGGAGGSGSGTAPGTWTPAPVAEVRTSSVTGEGMGELRRALLEAAFGGLRGSEQPALVTRRRHGRALRTALEEVRRFQAARASGHPPEIASAHLRDAAVALEELIGVTDVDEILGAIFASFCVGK